MDPVESTGRLEDASLAIYNVLGNAEVLNRARWLIIVQDKLISRLFPLIETIFGFNYAFDRSVIGSLGEGVSDAFRNGGKGDIDVLRIIKNTTVLMEPETVHEYNKWVFLSESCPYNAGYVKLKVIQRGQVFDFKFAEFIQTFFESTNDFNFDYLSNTLSVPSSYEPISSRNEYHHIENVLFSGLLSHVDINGPAFSVNFMPSFTFDKIDYVICISCPQWPKVAKDWIERRRPYGWPSQTFISQQVLRGCHVVPVGCKKCENNLDWRLSFSHVEQALVHSLNSTQFLCFFLLRQLKKFFFETRLGDKITSYIIKTTLFWTIEKTASSQWRPNRLLDMIQKCLVTLINFVQNNFCPNYFISDCNLLEGKYAVTDKPFVLKCCKHARRNTFEILSKILENHFNVSLMGCLAIESTNNVDIRTLSDTDIETYLFPMVLRGINSGMFMMFQLSVAYKHSISEATAHCKQAFTKLRSMESSCLVSCVQSMVRNPLAQLTWSERLLKTKTNKSKFSFIRALRYEFELMVDLSDKVIVCHLLATVEQYSLCNERLKAVISYQKSKPYLTVGPLVRKLLRGDSTSCDQEDSFWKYFHENASEFQLIEDIFFTKFEINLLPYPIQMELCALRKATCEKDLSYGLEKSVAIDSLVYACFLRFWCCMKMDRNIDKLQSRNDMVWVCNLPNITNKCVAFNLLGYCHLQLQEYKEALRAFCVALKQTPKSPATIYHIANLLVDRL